MSEAKIVVPAGMLKAAVAIYSPLNPAFTEKIVHAALCWLAGNPIVPTEGQLKVLVRDTSYHMSVNGYKGWLSMVVEWQRRMFLARDLAMSEDLKKLLVEEDDSGAVEFNKRIVQAYQLGQNQKEKEKTQ